MINHFVANQLKKKLDETKIELQQAINYLKAGRYEIALTILEELECKLSQKKQS